MVVSGNRKDVDVQRQVARKNIVHAIRMEFAALKSVAAPNARTMV